MSDNTKRYKQWKWKSLLMVCMAAFLLVTVPMKAEAATTCKSKIAYPAKTNAQVNMRKKAGTKYKTYGMLSKNSEVTILGYVENKNQTWYKCRGVVGGQTRTGYISAAYVTKEANPVGVVNNQVGSYLNVRKGAKTSSKCLMRVPKGTTMSVLGIKKKSGQYWYKVRASYNNVTKTGYVHSAYLDVQRGDVVASTPANTTTNDTSNTTNNTNTTNPTPPMENTTTGGQTLTGYVNEKVTSVLNVRNAATTQSAIITTIPSMTVVTILATEGSWYKINVYSGGKLYTGYVAAEYITIGELPGNNSDVADTSDATYEVLLSAFPDSYKLYLSALHKLYPNWKFVAVKTNLDWNTAVENESKGAKNVIQSNYPKGTSSLAPFSYLSTAEGDYDWSTDKYKVRDGSNWYSASKSVVAYYMDPRNFLNDKDIFQFEALAYDTSQTSSVVQNILKGTFMSGNYSVVDSATGQTVSGSYTQAFMDAGVTAKASPYFLAARSKQEVGVNGSGSTSGTYPGYEGIYNFYNIGAFDGTDAVAKGLSWAKTVPSSGPTYGKPWTNPYKAIVGGGQYIASTYINVGQNTLYFQKFNVHPTNSNNVYTHQYMTNVQAPYSEGRSTRNAYNNMGSLGNAMVFYIPIYNNMPANPCALPAAKGNPNPFLSGITIQSGNSTLSGLTPSFSKPNSAGVLSNNTYSMVVANSVTSITVTASTISKYATVSGTGTYALEAGKTKTITLTGKAADGRTQTYVICVTRQ